MIEVIENQIKCMFRIIFIRVPKNPSSIAELFMVIIEPLRVRVDRYRIKKKS